MKMLGVLGVMSLISGMPALAAPPGPIVVQAVVEQVFAPTGFDNNDNAQIVLRGFFPDSCHKIGPAEFKVNAKKKEILVQAKAYRYSGDMCLQVRTPWVKTIDLGVVPEGKYAVLSAASDKFIEKAELPISLASKSSPDDHNYAQVTDAVVDDVESPQGAELEIFGSFHVTCMRLKEVRMVHQAKNVFEVLPIVEINEDMPCSYPFLPIQYKKKLRLGRGVSGPVLVHVRSVEGNSVNRVVELP